MYITIKRKLIKWSYNCTCIHKSDDVDTSHEYDDISHEYVDINHEYVDISHEYDDISHDDLLESEYVLIEN
jgi:hypothetical protein